MKKIFIFGAGILLMLMAACAKDNSCVTSIADIINQGYEQHQAINDSSLLIKDIPEGDFFNWPDGNVFANEKIFAIIKTNPDYKLTEEDKDILINAVEQFISQADGDLEAIDANIMADHAKDTIRSSKTLKDLYGHGSTL